RFRKTTLGWSMTAGIAEIFGGIAGMTRRTSATIVSLSCGRTARQLQLAKEGAGMPESSTVSGLSFDIGTAASSTILTAMVGARDLWFASMILQAAAPKSAGHSAH